MEVACHLPRNPRSERSAAELVNVLRRIWTIPQSFHHATRGATVNFTPRHSVGSADSAACRSVEQELPRVAQDDDRSCGVSTSTGTAPSTSTYATFSGDCSKIV